MVSWNGSYHFKFFKGCLPQILLCSFLNTLTHLLFKIDVGKLLAWYGILEILEPGLRLLFNLLSTNPTKWSNTLKQLIRSLPTNCFTVSDHFVGLAFKGLMQNSVLGFMKISNSLTSCFLKM